MSIEAITWALTVPVGGNAKVVLLGLANHAHPDGTHSFPALDTLATYAHCDRSTAIRNVRKLEEDGWIVRTGEGPRGQVCYRLAVDRVIASGGGKTPRGKTPLGGGTSGTEGVAPAPPEPTTEPSDRSERARSSEAERHPHAVFLSRLLADLVREHDPKAAVKPASDAWVRDMRLLIAARDGDVVEVERVIRWSQTDRFWSGVILSPERLRKHFTELVLKARNGGAPPPRSDAPGGERAERRRRRSEALLQALPGLSEAS